MKASLSNSSLVIPLELLSQEQQLALKRDCTYYDEAVAYAIKRASNSPYGAKTIPALKQKLYVKLYEESDDAIIIPQGLAYLVPSSIPVEDLRQLPILKPMLWNRKPTKNMRYYQEEAISELLKGTRGQAVMATGTGKSFTMLNLVKQTGVKTLIVCPSSIIGKQLYSMFLEHFGKKTVGMFGAGKKEVKQVTIGLYQSVTKSIELFKDFEMVICDENQTLGASSLVAISRGLRHVPYFYSVSATNWRADGKTPEIYAASGSVVYNFDTKRAISEGFLAKPCFYVRKVASSGGDFELKQKNYAAHVVKNDRLNEQIIADVRKSVSQGRSTLVLVQEIEHGNLLSQALGVPLANGENKDSMNLIEDLNNNRIQCLVAGVQMCGVGVDTVRVDTLVMASFPGSEGLTLQLVGRGLRKYPGKEKVLVLDYWLPNNKMLGRHAENRVEWYESLGPVKIVGGDDCDFSE